MGEVGVTDDLGGLEGSFDILKIVTGLEMESFYLWYERLIAGGGHDGVHGLGRGDLVTLTLLEMTSHLAVVVIPDLVDLFLVVDGLDRLGSCGHAQILTGKVIRDLPGRVHGDLGALKVTFGKVKIAR